MQSVSTWTLFDAKMLNYNQPIVSLL
jgi:hypothetical protein